MRKPALIAVLCFGLLTGCGKIDTIENDSDTVTTVSSEEKETKPTTEGNTVPTAEETTAEPIDVTTEKTKETSKTTTATTTLGSLVRRTTVAVPKTSKAANHTTTKITGNAPVQSTSTTTTAVEIHHDPTVFTKDDLSCKVTKDGIDVTIGDEEVQTIKIDTEELLDFIENEVPDRKGQIIIDDVDLDGQPDLFIPQQIGILNTFGIYYHYDKEEEKFVEWEELEEIDSCAEVDKDEKTFTTDVKLSDNEYEIKIFGWEDSKPVLRSMTKQYRSADAPDDLFIDTFDYTNGEEVLIKRERVLFDNDGNIAGTEELELG